MDDKMAWDMYFAGLVSMTLHPGFNKPNTPKPTIEECAEIADEMLKYRPRENI